MYIWTTSSFFDDIEDHFGHVREILKILKGAGVSLKLARRKFFTETFQHLGHVIRPGTLSVDEARTAALRGANPPRTETELRYFLGLCNVYRRFVPGFAEVASPLNALLEKRQTIKLAPLADKELRAYRTLLDRIISPPILSLSKPDLPYSLDTVGVAAFQINESGRPRPIGFWSRSLLPAEKNYSRPSEIVSL